MSRHALRFCSSTRRIVAYFLRLTKSRCGMLARRAPNRLACVALHSVAVTIGLCSVRLPRMGATQYSRWTELHSLGATLLLAPAYLADSVSTRSARRSRFLCVGTPGAGHSCHRFCLHDRQVPFPSPDPLGTLGLPGIVSFHSQSLPHGGCDPPARMRGLMRSCGI
jgi:hypothetical protein